MADDKEKMPSDGSGTDMRNTDGNGELASRRDADSAGGLPNVGESGGGAYPVPNDGKSEGGFHGGQSRQGYYGKGQLGDKDVGENDNAVSTDE